MAVEDDHERLRESAHLAVGGFGGGGRRIRRGGRRGGRRQGRPGQGEGEEQAEGLFHLAGCGRCRRRRRASPGGESGGDAGEVGEVGDVGLHEAKLSGVDEEKDGGEQPGRHRDGQGDVEDESVPGAQRRVGAGQAEHGGGGAHARLRGGEAVGEGPGEAADETRGDEEPQHRAPSGGGLDGAAEDEQSGQVHREVEPGGVEEDVGEGRPDETEREPDAVDGEEEGERILDEHVRGRRAEQHGAHGARDERLARRARRAGRARHDARRTPDALRTRPAACERAQATARRRFAARFLKKARTSWMGSWSVERNIASTRLRRNVVLRPSRRAAACAA